MEVEELEELEVDELEVEVEEVQLLLFDACARPARGDSGPISVAAANCRKK